MSLNMNTIFFCGFFLSALACANGAPSITVRQIVLTESNSKLPMVSQDSSTMYKATTVDTATKKYENIITASDESKQQGITEGSNMSKSEYLIPRDLELAVASHRSQHRFRQGRQPATSSYDYENAQDADSEDGEFLFKR